MTTSRPVVRFEMQMKATLENVQEVRLTGGGEEGGEESFEFDVTFRCNTCMSLVKKTFAIDSNGECAKIAFMGGRLMVSVWHKCAECKRYWTAVYVDNSASVYTEQCNNLFKPMLALDCRDCTPLHFSPKSMLELTSNVAIEAGFTFMVNLYAGAGWADYDEISQQPISVCNVQYQFVERN